MITTDNERAFIAAQSAHFDAVKTGESQELFNERKRSLELSLLNKHELASLVTQGMPLSDYIEEMERRRNQK